MDSLLVVGLVCVVLITRDHTNRQRLNIPCNTAAFVLEITDVEYLVRVRPCLFLADSTRAKPPESSVTVHPQVIENRGGSAEKLLVIHDGHSLRLRKASVLVDRVLFREVTDRGVVDRYIDGKYYERHLYKDSEYEASLFVQPQPDGGYHMVGFINSTHSIKPIATLEITLSGRTPHVLSAIPRHGKVRASGRTTRRTYRGAPVKKQDVKLDLPHNFTVETYFISDYYHSKEFSKDDDLIKYATVFMLGIALRLQQLTPPGSIAVTGIQAMRSLQGESNYVGLSKKDVLLGTKTLEKMAQQAIFFYQMYLSDVIIMTTGRSILKEARDGKRTPALGMAFIGSACGHRKGAVAQDKAGTYSGLLAASHELGHLLNCSHDGEADSKHCSTDNGYIMHTGGARHSHYKFSPCSQQAIKNFLRSSESSCLRSNASFHESLLPDDNLTTGHVIDGHDYCKRYFPDKDVTLEKATDNCHFRCKLGNPRKAVDHADIFAPDGTTCDKTNTRKKCKYGLCILSRH